MRYLRGLWSILAVITLFAAPSLLAQQFSAVNGTVSDSSGGVIADVKVSLDNSLTGFHAETSTNNVGSYRFVRIDTGDGYAISFSKVGFQKFVFSNITMGVSTTETYNVTLQLGSVATSVEVKAAGEITLNTSDASVGNVIDTKSISELPIQARLDPANLLVLQAGVNDAGSITGARSDQGNITLDGLDVNDQATGQAFTSTIPISIDSVQEIRTVTAGETADYGRSSGGGINMVTKSGSNDWHGNAREYNRNTLFEANDWFNNRSDVPRAPLIRNQFGGSLGGPVKKDKLFFFFDYEGLRQAASEDIERSVPTASFAVGNLSYINSNLGCNGASRLNTQPGCISTLTPNQVAALDPAGIGVNAALLSVIDARYPAPNDPSGGDGVNSEGFRFTAPAHESYNVYTTRIDYTLNQKNKIFVRGSVARAGVDDDFNTDIVQFPGDPSPNSRDTFNEYAFSVGWDWAKSSRFVNTFSAGLVRTILTFPALENPTYPNLFEFGGPISNPYLSSAAQSRNVPVPEFRDGATWTIGKHTLDFGEDVKLIRQISALKNDFNFIGVGLGGNLIQLDPSERPGDINSDPSAVSNWDNTFPFLLGRYSGVTSNFNYSKDGTAFPNGTGKNRDYNYDEFELYFQDSWKVRSDLTITAGLRWDYHTVPYEVNGYQSVPSVNEPAYFSARQANALNGVSGVNATPFQTYNLGGPANNAAGYYNPDYKDFGPRIALAYNPGFRDGLLASIFGDRKSTIRVGGAILYDRIAGGASFGLDQNTFLFDSQANNPFGNLATDPRFTGYNSLPSSGFLPAPPGVTPPVTPNVTSTGFPYGLLNGGFPSFFQFNTNTKTPYAIVMNMGFQRELPGNFLLEANYVGRLGRRLLAVGDAATITNFKDPASGQFLRTAFGNIEKEVQTGQPITNQPFFENQMGGTGNCQANLGTPSCTAAVVDYLGQLVAKGDLSDTVQQLALYGYYYGAGLGPNVGLPAQTGANGYIGNYASSNYNGLLLTLRKRISKGLQFDFNYTLSHSIDNMSEITNNYVTYTGSGAGLVCDLGDLRTCRASSNFDARHVISANYVYDLPFGRGRSYMTDAPRWIDAIAGGWSWSGIVTWRTGYPFTINTGAFPTAYTLDSPALVLAPGGLKSGIHTDSGGNLQFFNNADTAISSLSFPEGGMIGTRNAVRGPGIWNIDMGVSKAFTMPWSEKHRLVLRGDAFNVFNHPSFSAPGSTLSNLSSFGLITSTQSTPRVLQVALRYEF
jgi:Carboxypeptidase regulatory-like domain